MRLYLSTWRTAQENEGVGYVDLLGTTDLAVSRLIVNVNYINIPFHIQKNIFLLDVSNGALCIYHPL